MSNTQNSKNFPPVVPGKNFSDTEKEILEYWKENQIFEKSVEKNPADNEFVFFDGPPFATGTPHYGHILAGTIKDAIPRYMTMKGYRVNRKFGWDCHGVPVEFLIEKEHKIGGKPGIEKMGTGPFNDLCQSAVMRCADEWESTVERMGRFVDFKNDYKTMDADYMESVWSVFRELWNKGLIYEGEKVVSYSPRLGSPLSNFEANQNYKQIKDKTLTVKFELEDEPNTYVLAWTTTPWTLPSNLALCVNPELEYVKIDLTKIQYDDGTVDYLRHDRKGVYKEKHGNNIALGTENIIVAKDLARKLLGNYVFLKDNLGSVQDGSFWEPDWNHYKSFKGKDLVGKKYKPLFDFYKDHENGFQILGDDFVSADSGTGIVHLAPNFGEDDANVCTKNGIRFLEQPIDENGYFDFSNIEVEQDENTKKLQRKYFREDEVIPESIGRENNANDVVIQILKDKGLVFKQDQYDHDYPFCWRTDCALMYRGIKTWFVDVQKIKKLMIEKNQNINWIPEHLREGRFGKILETAPDWAISRNRYWGAPIPVWKCENEKCDHTEVVSTRAKLEEKTGKKVTDIHKQYVDDLTWECEKCASKKRTSSEVEMGDNSAFDSAQAPLMRRILEVLDCWFESGAMPYASRGVHFQDKNSAKPVPADFIAEGLDQTRGWFYTLHVLGCALTGENIYKNVITNGIVLAEDGQKMSKSKKNYPDPNLIFEKYGADAMRFYMLSSPVVRAENFRFMESGVQEVVKTILLPLQNVYAFFSTYANIDGWLPEDNILNPKTDLDKWILSEYEKLRIEFTENFETYRLDDALRNIPDFIDGLTNWFVRRSRNRFWEGNPGEISKEKKSGYETLYFILKNLAKILAPICPFFAENLWQNITGKKPENSVHLQSLAESAEKFLDSELSERTKLLRETIKLASSIRARKKIKLKQPLAKLSFALSGKIQFTSYDLEILKEEANVKEVVMLENLKGLAKQIVKPNARIIGKRFGKKTQEVIKAGKSGNFELIENGVVKIAGEILREVDDEFEFGFECAEGIEGDGNRDAVVLLDTYVSEELALEGISREIIRNIQEGRKKANFQISDRIFVKWFTKSKNLKKSYKEFYDKIDTETLTKKREFTSEDFGVPPENFVRCEIDGEEILFGLSVLE